MRYIYSILLATALFVSQVGINTNVYASVTNCGSSNSIDYSCLPQVAANHTTLALILNIVFSIIGAVSVLIIVISGFKFITSSGKPEEVAKAKDTIIYAAVGLIICVLAVTIVSFVAGYI